jgi:peptide/nickel transport system permease protein
MTAQMPAAVEPAGTLPAAMDRPALGPWARAARKLWGDKAAMAALSLFLLIVLVCLLAPFYASQIAHTDPFTSNIDGEITMDGQQVALLQPSDEGLGLGSTPIGPTWDISNYFLGADTQGRDVMARIFYGGRNSLVIAGTSTVICLFLAALMGLIAGFFGGIIDTILSRVLDVIWAFPIFLLAISLSIVLIAHGIDIGPISITAGSLWLPIFIIGIVYVPYVARPVRGQVLALKESEFVLAAIGLGVPSHRILIRDILPNVMTTLIVFVPLLLAINMLTESALSFLSIGVQAPDASWGTIIQDGQDVLYTRPWVAIAPGIAIVLTVLALNVLGDGVRDALDPRAKLRIR